MRTGAILLFMTMLYWVSLNPTPDGTNDMGKHVFFSGSEPGSAKGTANVGLRMADATVIRIRHFGVNKFIERVKKEIPEVQSVDFPKPGGLYAWLTVNISGVAKVESLIDEVVRKIDELVISILD